LPSAITKSLVALRLVGEGAVVAAAFEGAADVVAGCA
jgi:hypothetical protein